MFCNRVEVQNDQNAGHDSAFISWMQWQRVGGGREQRGGSMADETEAGCVVGDEL